MATVLEENTTEEQHSLVRFLWTKVISEKDIHKVMFPVYGGKFLSRKAVHKLVEKFSRGRPNVEDDARPGAEVAETTLKNFYAGGYDALVKRWDKCINVGGGYVEKDKFFPG
jgi:hypothetical protein